MGSADVAGNVRGVQDTIDKNEEHIKLVAPERLSRHSTLWQAAYYRTKTITPMVHSGKAT